jgi:hypothetical protein
LFNNSFQEDAERVSQLLTSIFVIQEYVAKTTPDNNKTETNHTPIHKPNLIPLFISLYIQKNNKIN